MENTIQEKLPLPKAKEVYDMFKTIPDEAIIPGKVWSLNQQGQGCYVGQYGLYTTGDPYENEEGYEFADLVERALGINMVDINNEASDRFPQKTPKKRIMAALKEMIRLGH